MPVACERTKQSIVRFNALVANLTGPAGRNTAAELVVVRVKASAEPVANDQPEQPLFCPGGERSCFVIK